MNRIWQAVTSSAAATEQFGERMGQNLRGGEVIELISDLGGGKTTFVRGLARGLGSNDKVSSPTFTISQEYEAGDKRLYHFDFYRLGEAGIMSDELAEAIADPKAVTVVEWGDIVCDVLPEGRLTMRIVATGENEREIILTYPERLAYAVPKDVK